MEAEMKCKKIALCGYRQKGKQLYKQLIEAGIEVPYILERNYEALCSLEKDLSLPIVGFEEKDAFYMQADAIMLSGDIPEAVIKECLELRGIKIPIITDIRK